MIQLNEVYVTKFDDKEEVIGDVLCIVLGTSDVTVAISEKEISTSESFRVVHCLNPETGEIASPKLSDVIVKSYTDENKKLVTISSPIRREERSSDRGGINPELAEIARQFSDNR